MSQIRSALVFSLLALLGSSFAPGSLKADDSPAARIPLHSDWRMESSCKLSAKADAISQRRF